MGGPSSYGRLDYGGQTSQTIAQAAAATGGAVATEAAGTTVAVLTGTAAAGTAIPVAGWIVAGGLLAIAGVITLFNFLHIGGRKKAREEARKLFGKAGDDFVNSFAKWSRKPNAKVRKERQKLHETIAAYKSGDRKPLFSTEKSRAEKVQKLTDQLNAVKMVIWGRQEHPGQPLIAGETNTIPEVVEQTGGTDGPLGFLDEIPPWVLWGSVGTVGLLLISKARR